MTQRHALLDQDQDLWSGGKSGLGQTTRAVESLLKFLTEQRDCLVNNALDTAMHTATMDIPVVRRVHKNR